MNYKTTFSGLAFAHLLHLQRHQLEGTLAFCLFYSFPTRHQLNDKALTILYHTPICDMSTLCAWNCYSYYVPLMPRPMKDHCSKISFRITNVFTMIQKPLLKLIWIENESCTLVLNVPIK